MKVCLVLQRRFAFIGHNLAVILKEKHGFKNFCAYVNQRPSFNFLKNQKDIQYTELLLDADVYKKHKEEKLDIGYLRWLEKEYGIPNLWPYIAVDRVIMFNQLVREYPYNKSPYTHEEMLKILQVTAKSLFSFLDEEKPNIILFSVIAGLGNALLYQIAKKGGIKTLVLLSNIVKDTSLLSEDYQKVTGPEFNFTGEENNLLEAEKFLDQFRNRPTSYHIKADLQSQQINRLKQFEILRPKKFFRFLSWIIHYFCHHFFAEERFDYDYIGPWNYLKDGFRRKVRNIIGLNDLYDELNLEEEYAFFPLQLEPEFSLLLLAPFKSNQLEVIRQTARSLPVGYKLYVKEHPQMVMYRPRSYYKELKKIPNVKIINPATISYELIKNAKLITTITGTTGWEATLLKKPVITFGEVFYNQFSFVKNCRAYEDLPYLIKEQIENFQYNENELLVFLANIFKFSAKGLDMTYLWEEEGDLEKQKKALEPLADLLAQKLGLL